VLFAFCDGSITGGHWGKKDSAEPARCWSGWMVKAEDGTVLHHHSLAIGAIPDASANVAEYMAVRSVLVWLATHGHVDQAVRVHSDSQLVVNQLSGKFKCHDARMLMLRDHVLELAALFPRVSYVWIPREENRYADYMSKVIQRGGAIPPVPLPPATFARSERKKSH
jgi:ribonuclease HI